jgi:prepilin-type N-terminal cleavage/methylation domain-containing protein
MTRTRDLATDCPPRRICDTDYTDGLIDSIRGICVGRDSDQFLTAKIAKKEFLTGDNRDNGGKSKRPRIYTNQHESIKELDFIRVNSCEFVDSSSSVFSVHSVANLRRAFTLIEVMLSLAILLLLMVGMNQVFRTTSDAVRAGQELGELTRNSRAVRPVFFDDLRNCATDSPAFIISSCIVPQYVNSSDANAGGTLPTSGCLLNNHMHRADQVSFFVRGLFKRKTANNPEGSSLFLNSTTTSDEAFIHYGHLRTLSNDGVDYIGPDDTSFGTSQPLAADWVLGRNLILLGDGKNLLGNNAKDLAGNPEVYSPPSSAMPGNMQMPQAWPASATPANVLPLGSGSPSITGTENGVSYTSANNQTATVQTSRYDLAGVTMDQFRSIISTAADAQAGASTTIAPFYTWWAPLVYQASFKTKSNVAWKPNVYPLLIYTGFETINGQLANQSSRYRFQGASSLGANPFGYNSSTNKYEGGTDEANLAPYYLEHVSQFVVEYAGDFVTQADGTANFKNAQGATIAAGEVSNTVPDGQIDWVYATKGKWNANTSYSAGDYVLIPAVGGTTTTDTFYQAGAANIGISPPSAPWGVVNMATNPPPKAIRWYGMPRDATGSGTVTANPPGRFTVDRIAVTAAELNNVVPLADVWTSGGNNNANNGGTTPLPVPYEVETGPTLFPNSAFQASSAEVAGVSDYAGTGGSIATAGLGYSGGAANTSPAQARYTAVWRNDVPAMVRILIKVDDPNNTLADGPWFEYVFKLK